MRGRGENRPRGTRRGSVILEFLLTMPILLLLFGAAMLWMDLSLAKAHVQESNRNISWIGNDRYDDGAIGAALDEAAKDFYEQRNRLERKFDGGANSRPFWQFGLVFTNDLESLKKGKRLWTNDVWQLDIPDGYRWGGFYSGNLDVRMTRLSGAYLGAVAVGDVLYPNGAKNPFYRAQYVLTRSRQTVPWTNAVVAASFNPESILVHRRGDPDVRENVTTPNNLLPVLLDPMPLGGLGLYQGDGLPDGSWGDLYSTVAGTAVPVAVAGPCMPYRRLLYLFSGDHPGADDFKATYESVSSIFKGSSPLKDDLEEYGKMWETLRELGTDLDAYRSVWEAVRDEWKGLRDR